ncbi:MAG: MFS transporter, partial [Acidobacteriota bacterium]
MLNDRVYIVTGGTTGIGAGITAVLRGYGARVAAWRFEDCDVRDPAQVEAATAATVAEYGRLDGVVNNAGLNAGLVGGGALAGYLGEEYGWRIGLFFLGAVGIVLSGVCLLALPASPRSQAPAPPAPVGPQLRGLLRRRGYLLLAMQGMLISVSTWMFFTWMPLYFRESFGLSLALAGFSGTAVLQLSAVGGALVGGTLSD